MKEVEVKPVTVISQKTVNQEYTSISISSQGIGSKRKHIISMYDELKDFCALKNLPSAFLLFFMRRL